MADRPTYVWSGSEWDAVADPGAVRKALIDDAGDLLVGSADNTVGRLPLGTNGQVLTVDTAGSGVNKVKWADAAAGGSGSNLIINGAMQVAQRNTSVAGITSGAEYRTADRWMVQVNFATFTASVENDAPTGSGLRKSLKMLCTTGNASPGATDLNHVQYRWEGQDVQRIKKGTASAEQLTLSFWVKSNVTGTYVAVLYDQDNSGRFESKQYSISASGTWEQKVLTFTADTGNFPLDNDNANSLRLYFMLASGATYTSGSPQTWGAFSNGAFAPGQTNLAASTNNYWQITGVQLETGPVATPFEFEPYEATLRKCQRYYYRTTGTAAFSKLSLFGAAYATTNTQGDFVMPVPMRTGVTSIDWSTLAVNDNATNTAISAASVGSGFGGTEVVGVYFTSTGLTVNRPYQIVTNNNAAGYIGFSAEL